MGGTGDHYIMWNKPGLERRVPCDLTHMWDIKKVDVIWVDSKIVVIRVGEVYRGGRMGKSWSVGIRLQSIRVRSFGDLLHIRVTIDNNNVVYI